MTPSSKMNHSKKICIIGGGCAGLSAAVYLDSLRHQVHLIEKKPVLGGRTYSFKDRITQTWVDNGQHLLMGAYHNTIEFLSMIGSKNFLSPQPRLEVPLFDKNNQLQWLKALPLPGALGLISAIGRLSHLSLREKWAFVTLGLELQKIKKNRPHGPLSVSCEEWLIRLGQSEKVRAFFWEPLILATLNDNPKKASAKLLAEVMIRGFMGSSADSRLIIPTGHLNEVLCDPARNYLTKRGHRVETAAPVSTLQLLDGQVQCIELQNGHKIFADAYVAAVPPAALARMIPDGFVKSLPWFSDLSVFEGAPIISINLWFDREIMPYRFAGTSHKKIHWYFNRTRCHDAKDGQHHHVIGVVSGAHDWLESSKQEILEHVLEELKCLYPIAKEAKLQHSLINKEREATLSLPPEVDALRPGVQSPLPNLWIAGDWIQTALPCTIESAVTSGKMVAEAFQKSLL